MRQGRAHGTPSCSHGLGGSRLPPGAGERIARLPRWLPGSRGHAGQGRLSRGIPAVGLPHARPHSLPCRGHVFGPGEGSDLVGPHWGLSPTRIFISRHRR